MSVNRIEGGGRDETARDSMGKEGRFQSGITRIMEIEMGQINMIFKNRPVLMNEEIILRFM
jgi:hypothetical protein